jgi:class 3 adenylate cyclase
MPLAFQCHSSASQDRLEQLIVERLSPGTDKDSIDQRIWDLFGESWAVMFTDLAGFSRGIADFGVIHFLQVIYESQRLLLPVVAAHDGILLKMEGDSMLVIFRNTAKAAQCAIAMQQVVAPYNAQRQANERVDLCIGLGFGKVLRVGDTDVFGAEVNAAAKLGEDTAKSGEILITGAVAQICGVAGGLVCEPIDYVPPGAGRAFRLRY